MSLHKLLATLLLFSIGCSGAQACVCETEVNKERVSQWVEDRMKAASYVFPARITEVKSSGKLPALDKVVEFETLEQLKGVPRFPSLTISECQNFELKKNDTRVLFVSAEGMICGCTEYRRFINDARLLNMLRTGVTKNAN
jgi:hypothetical protein